MDLIRKINSVGKASFVENFELFKRFVSGKIDRETIIEQLIQLGVSNRAGASIRVGNAKLIFEAGKQNEALEIIANSEKVPQSITTKARVLLKKVNR